MKKSIELSHSGIKLLITKRINNKQEVLFAKKKDIANVDYFDLTMHSKIAKEINNLVFESFEFLDIHYDSIDISVPLEYCVSKYKATKIQRINSSQYITLDELRNIKGEITKTSNSNYKAIFFNPKSIKLDRKIINKHEIFSTKAKQIELEGFVYYCEKNILKMVDKIFGKTSITYSNIYPTGINLATFIENVDKELILIDVGYKYTSLIKYLDNNLYDQKHFNIGGKNIVNSIMKSFDLNHKEAKNYLERFGIIPPERIKDNRIILTRYDDNMQEYREYTMKNLSEIITNKINNIFDKIVPVLEKYGKCKIVITGGLADLKGLLEYVLTRYSSISFDIVVLKTIGTKETSFINLFSLNKLINIDNKLVNTNETKINDKIRISNNLFGIKNMLNKWKEL